MHAIKKWNVLRSEETGETKFVQQKLAEAAI
jgi:hypothetical protein